MVLKIYNTISSSTYICHNIIYHSSQLLPNKSPQCTCCTFLTINISFLKYLQYITILKRVSIMQQAKHLGDKLKMEIEDFSLHHATEWYCG